MKVITIVTVHFFLQAELSSNIETAANDIQIPLEVTGCHMKPVVVLETLDLTR